MVTMAKLIKKRSVEENTNFDVIPEKAENRRGAIIDRDTYEARSDAQQIRERAAQQADDLVAEKQAELDTLLAEAREEAISIKEKAREEGYKEGKEAGAEELSALVLRSSQRFASIEEELVPQLTELAVSIARRVLGKELEFHPEAVVEIVKHALAEKARQRREISLRVHPDDLAVIREHRAELLEILSRTKEIAIREDPSVERHGVIIETDAGIIDAQLETQLAAFERVLKEVG
jgi:flagellar biosynthesis/type III secretory pathway protein FliH